MSRWQKTKFYSLVCVAVLLLFALAVFYAPPLCSPANTAQSQPVTATTIFLHSRIDINTADAESLASLPGIGMKKAEAICEYRLFNGYFETMDDVAQVEGITLEIIEGWGVYAFLSTNDFGG